MVLELQTWAPRLILLLISEVTVMTSSSGNMGETVMAPLLYFSWIGARLGLCSQLCHEHAWKCRDVRLYRNVIYSNQSKQHDHTYIRKAIANITAGWWFVSVKGTASFLSRTLHVTHLKVFLFFLCFGFLVCFLLPVGRCAVKSVTFRTVAENKCIVKKTKPLKQPEESCVCALCVSVCDNQDHVFQLNDICV